MLLVQVLQVASLLLVMLLPAVGAQQACGFAYPYPYERVPTNQAGGSWIGGCGGSPFSHHDKGGSPVKDIRVWTDGGNVIRGIWFSTFSGKTFQAGTISVGNPKASFTFEPGERLKGSMVLTGNGIGTTLGHMSFTTDRNRKFEVGPAKTNYFFDSKDSFLMGFWGRAGSDLDHLGFYLMKEIEGYSLVEVVYDETSYNPNGGPGDLSVSGEKDHESPLPGSLGVKYERTVSTTKEWSLSATLGFKIGASVTAGIPEVASGTANWEMDVSVSASYTNQEFKSTTSIFEEVIPLPPCSKTTYQLFYFSGVVNVKFTGKERIRFTDGTWLDLERKGTYKGVANARVYSNTSSVPYAPGERLCAKTDAPTPAPGGGPSDFAGSRRHLLSTATLMEPEDDIYKKHLHACGDFFYKADLYVDRGTHLYALGYPAEDEAVAAGCPMVASHVVLATETTPVRKELLGWEDANEGLAMFEEEGRLSMGTFKLKEFDRAYQAAEPDATGGGLYDVVTNNCGTFMANLAFELDVPVDSRVTNFVASRLVKNSAGHLGKQIRDSLNYFGLVGHRGLRTNPTDEELITMVVEQGVARVHA